MRTAHWHSRSQLRWGKKIYVLFAGGEFQILLGARRDKKGPCRTYCVTGSPSREPHLCGVIPVSTGKRNEGSEDFKHLEGVSKLMDDIVGMV